jgi:hypothetical protein
MKIYHTYASRKALHVFIDVEGDGWTTVDRAGMTIRECKVEEGIVYALQDMGGPPQSGGFSWTVHHGLDAVMEAQLVELYRKEVKP